jgi:DNA repair ATPase RecN
MNKPDTSPRNAQTEASSHDKQLLSEAASYLHDIVRDLHELLAGKERGKAGVIGRNLQRSVIGLNHLSSQLHTLPEAQKALNEILNHVIDLFPGLRDAIAADKVSQWAKYEMTHPAMSAESFTEDYEGWSKDVVQRLHLVKERLTDLTAGIEPTPTPPSS